MFSHEKNEKKKNSQNSLRQKSNNIKKETMYTIFSLFCSVFIGNMHVPKEST